MLMLKKSASPTEMSQILDAITSEILTTTAKKTKTGSQRKVRDQLDKALRKPFQAYNTYVHRTRAGKVYFSRTKKSGDWTFVAQSKDGVSLPPIRARKSVSRGKQTNAEYRRARAHYNEWRKTEKKKRISRIGLSKATWIHLMAKLNLRPSSISGLSKAMKVKMPASVDSFLSAKRSTKRNDINITIKSTSMAALNRYAGGLQAFSRAFTGKGKQLVTSIKKDAMKTGRALRNKGIDVRG